MAAHEPGAKQIDVTTLPIPHLNHLSQQLEQVILREKISVISHRWKECLCYRYLDLDSRFEANQT